MSLIDQKENERETTEGQTMKYNSTAFKMCLEYTSVIIILNFNIASELCLFVIASDTSLTGDPHAP